jgi:hypothetical protein
MRVAPLFVMARFTAADVFVATFGKTPKCVNGKFACRMSPSAYAKFAAKWHELSLGQNVNQGFFYYTDMGLLSAWG